MSIETLVKQIRRLPYTDMMLIAGELADKLSKNKEARLNAKAIADILSRLQEGTATISEGEQRDEEILKKEFSRKRAFNIQRTSVGWQIALSAGSVGHGATLRDAFSALLDQTVTMSVLKR